jgi:hypothetical protein
MARRVHSNESIDLSRGLTVRVLHHDEPAGGALPVDRQCDMDKFYSVSKSLIDACYDLPIDGVQMCLPRCFIVALARQKLIKEEYCWVRKAYARQTKLAMDLTTAAKLNPVNADGSPYMYTLFHDVEKLRIATNLDLTVVVFTSNHQKTTAPYVFGRGKLHIYLHLNVEKRHWYVIGSITGHIGCKTWCEKCYTPYDEKHKCAKSMCVHCQNIHCKNKNTKVKEVICKCNGEFMTAACRTAHQKSGKCDKKLFCTKCNTYIQKHKFDHHECGWTYCSRCAQKKYIIHDCFVAIPKPKTKQEVTHESTQQPKDATHKTLLTSLMAQVTEPPERIPLAVLEQSEPEISSDDDDFDETPREHNPFIEDEAESDDDEEPKKKKVKKTTKEKRIIFGDFECALQLTAKGRVHVPTCLVLSWMDAADDEDMIVYEQPDLGPKFIKDVESGRFNNTVFIFHNAAVCLIAFLLFVL